MSWGSGPSPGTPPGHSARCPAFHWYQIDLGVGAGTSSIQCSYVAAYSTAGHPSSILDYRSIDGSACLAYSTISSSCVPTATSSIDQGSNSAIRLGALTVEG